jgi:uncharacterized integral membrane protein (TIGR00698 family)
LNTTEPTRERARPVALVILVAAALLAISPWGWPAAALLSGVGIALVFSNPIERHSVMLSRHILAIAIVALGAGTPFGRVLEVGWQGLGYTAIGIVLAFALARLLERTLSVPSAPALLVASGTAICGGSAIAAVASVLKSKDSDIALAIACVFLLNGVALIVFPPLGHYFALDQHQFGLWAALAIHDTSSVVGAASAYGPEALATATTAKLARALWILPMALTLLWLKRLRAPASTARLSFWKLVPWFIPGFLIASALGSLVPQAQELAHLFHTLAKPAFALALLLIGLSVNARSIVSLGPKLFAMAILLWLSLSAFSLLAIKNAWID